MKQINIGDLVYLPGCSTMTFLGKVLDINKNGEYIIQHKYTKFKDNSWRKVQNELLSSYKVTLPLKRIHLIKPVDVLGIAKLNNTE